MPIHFHLIEMHNLKVLFTIYLHYIQTDKIISFMQFLICSSALQGLGENGWEIDNRLQIYEGAFQVRSGYVLLWFFLLFLCSWDSF